MQEVEESVKARTNGEAGAAKTLCMPFEQDTLPMVSNTLAEGAYLLFIVLWVFRFSIYSLRHVASYALRENLFWLTLSCWATISGTKCFASGKPTKKWALWGRSY